MTDRELLELAAKAAGYTLRDHYEGYPPIAEETNAAWNPLADDGDTFRLARACNLTIQFRPGRFNVGKCPAFDVCCAGGMDEVRYAIVRAAAEIGKGMETK